MKYLEDPRLYHDTAYCLAFCRELKLHSHNLTAPRTLFHIYWSGPFSRKVTFALKSFIATQNPERVEAWLWLDGAGTDLCAKDAFAAALGSAVRILIYDPVEQAHDMPLASAPALLQAQSPAARSDAFRLVVLFRYGGVYVDADTMFLRDFSVLIERYGGGAFCYRWSARQNFATNALMYMARANPLGMQLMRLGVALGSCHPRHLLRHDCHANADLLELPCAFFDPLWPHFDQEDHYADTPFKKFRDFFRPFGLLHHRNTRIQSMADFFPGAFAYQWHGLWNMPEYKDSYFGMFEHEIDAQFESRQTYS